MPTLADYTDEVRDLLRDPNASFYSQAQINSWINKARRRVAMLGQCVRVKPPSSGYVTGLTIDDQGSGYTTATITISAPDAQGYGWSTATATATVSGGSITAVNLTNPGTGYVGTPTVTIEGDGTGAEITAALSEFVATVANQEVYEFQDISALIADNMPGYGDIIGLQGVSVSWGALRPTLRRLDWSTFQAQYRAYPLAQNYPLLWAQYGQGVNGSIYVSPVPSQVAQMEWDCYCDVQDLSDGQTVDAVPYPFSEAVQYWAARLGFLYAQRPGDADNMGAKFNEELLKAREGSTTSMVPDFYPVG